MLSPTITRNGAIRASSSSSSTIRISTGHVGAAGDGRLPEVRGYRFEPVWVGPDDLERIHGVDERVGIDNFVRGIGFYAQLIRNSASGAADRRGEDVVADSRR